MQYGRKLKTDKEKMFWKAAYKIGMNNPWASGKAAIEDGDFIVEEDRLNMDSVTVIEDIETLREFFKAGNWCLGQAVIYKSLVFMQQENGGDEWLTMKRFIPDNEVIDFESVTFMPMAYEYADIEGEHYQSYRGSKEKCSKAGHFVDYINRLLKAKRVPSKHTIGKMVVDY